MSKLNHKFILGTGGTPDYLIIGQNGGVVLGVKVLVEPISKEALFIGVRLRAVVSPVGQTVGKDNVTKLPVTMTFKKAFAKIDFQKVSSGRASTVIGGQVSVSILDVEAIKKIINKIDYYKGFTNYLKKNLVKPAAQIGSMEEIQAWMKERVDNILGKNLPKKSSKKETTKKKIKSADIIPINKAKKVADKMLTKKTKKTKKPKSKK